MRTLPVGLYFRPERRHLRVAVSLIRVLIIAPLLAPVLASHLGVSVLCSLPMPVVVIYHTHPGPPKRWEALRASGIAVAR